MIPFIFGGISAVYAAVLGHILDICGCATAAGHVE